jgi:hypothetical protein
MMPGTRRTERLYRRLVPDAAATADDEVSEHVRRSVPANGIRIIGASSLQNIGDRIVDAKTVLPWVFASIGAPTALIGLLVPIRESGSMLPQAALLPWVRRRAVRKWVWVAGAAGQAVATVAMALITATASGAGAGIAILGMLAVFALSRALTSIAAKDVLGRTIPKGQRGQINGIATVVAGAVAITIGLAIRLFGGAEADPAALAAVLGAGALTWVAALFVYATVVEAPGEVDEGDDDGWLSHAWGLLSDDSEFRRFVLVRTLLLVSALSPPFVVALATEPGGLGLSGLGPFVIASGLAGLLGGRAFGRLADRSSRRLMTWGAAASSAVIMAFLAVLAAPAARDLIWLYPVVYFLLTLMHTGVRVARKTYVVDLATGNQRTDYVAVSNTAMGVLLLMTGAVSSALAQWGPEIALVFLAALGMAGVLVSRTLPEVSRIAA